jgi:Peptidase S46.
VLAAAKGKTGRAYHDAIEQASKQIVAECEADGSVRCSVANMYYGSDFYRIAQVELQDVRLVYAPPRAIGNYGDEIDNFMWPRHTGDFTLLRAYVGPDGKPAPYSEHNVPYRNPAFLRLSSKARRKAITPCSPATRAPPSATAARPSSLRRSTRCCRAGWRCSSR